MLVIAIPVDAQSQREFVRLIELILQQHIEESGVLLSRVIGSTGPHIHISEGIISHKSDILRIVFAQRYAGLDVGIKGSIQNIGTPGRCGRKSVSAMIISILTSTSAILQRPDAETQLDTCRTIV